MTRLVSVLLAMLCCVSLAHADGIVNGGSSSLVIGTTPITGGADTQVLFNNAGVISSDAGLTKVAGASGQVNFGGGIFVTTNITMAATSLFSWSGRGGLFGPADGTVQISNNAGSSRINLAVSGGNPGLLTLNGQIALSAIGTDSGQTATATVCEDTTTHQFYFGSGTGGICKGTSGRQFKRDIRDITDLGLSNVIALEPKRYYNREGKGLDTVREQVGLIADEVRKAMPDCADENTVDYLCVSVISLNAIKALAAEFEELKRRVH